MNVIVSGLGLGRHPTTDDRPVRPVGLIPRQMVSLWIESYRCIPNQTLPARSCGLFQSEEAAVAWLLQFGFEPLDEQGQQGLERLWRYQSGPGKPAISLDGVHILSSLTVGITPHPVAVEKVGSSGTVN
jgi:hypothetical protein